MAQSATAAELKELQEKLERIQADLEHPRELIQNAVSASEVREIITEMTGAV